MQDLRNFDAENILLVEVAAAPSIGVQADAAAGLRVFRCFKEIVHKAGVTDPACPYDGDPPAGRLGGPGDVQIRTHGLLTP